MMKGADGDRNGCSVHKGASRVSGGSIRKTGMLFFGGIFHSVAHKTGGVAEGKWARKY